ncbi:MAG: nucleoside-diphosphate sugar epimerase, partial [Verrucomicrobiota bacterium]
RKARRVRSVQRMPLPTGWDAPRVADEYGKWLTRSSFSIINVEKSKNGTLRFLWRWPEISLLELHPSDLTRHQQGRRVFYIRGGWLTRSREEPHGRFEFRVVEEGKAIIAAIHEYAPRLPWFIYQFTQAKTHLLVMYGFGAHLRKKCGD